jgi:hypothetical protein
MSRLTDAEIEELANWRDDEEARGWVRGHVRRLLAEVRELRAAVSRKDELLRWARKEFTWHLDRCEEKCGTCIQCGLNAELSPKEVADGG